MSRVGSSTALVDRKLRSFVRHVRNKEFAYLRDRLGRLVWSELRRIVMRRDLYAAAPTPRAFAEFTLRPLELRDLEVLFADLPAHQAEDREWLERLIHGGLAGGHVAVLSDGTPCFVQWLLTAAQNARIAELSDGRLPPLPPDTVMLEAAFTPPRFRRLAIMPAAMAKLAGQGVELGARWAIVCVATESPSMQTAAKWAGFENYQLRIERRRLFRRNTFNVELPPELDAAGCGSALIQGLPRPHRQQH